MSCNKHLRIACISDLHGHLPPPVEADLTLIAGDICPHGNDLSQFVWLASKFQPWLRLWKNPVVYIGGNHDYVFARWPGGVFPGLIGGTYLENSGTRPFCYDDVPHRDLTVFGSPHSLRTDRCVGAFTTNETSIECSLPEQADILVVHTPPWFIGDRTYEGIHPGSIAVREWIERKSPRLVVCGHIHESRGVYQYNNTLVVNAAVYNENMSKTRDPIIIDL